jgi:integrase
MPNVRFNLKNPNDKEETLILLVFRYDTKKLVYSTEEKVPPRFWNAKEQRVARKREFPTFSEINAFLDSLEFETQKFFRRYRNDNKKTPTFDEIKAALDTKIKGKVTAEVEKITFFTFFNTYIEEKKVTAPRGTWKIFLTIYNHLQKYCTTQKIKKLDFEDVDITFFNGFKDYMFNVVGNSTNYTSKVFDFIKIVMSEGLERGLHTNLQYKSKKFNLTLEPTYAVYLTESELKKIINYDFTDNKRLDKARDLFIVGCYTGLRYSDYSALKIGHFTTIEREDGTRLEVIKKTTEKTTTPVIIPVFAEVKTILEKYGGEPPPKISNQKLNTYIKEVCELVGIHDSVTIPVNKAGKSEEQTFKKFELVSSHTARRSFATNAHLKGLPSHEIMLITGHSTETQFKKYIRVTNEENAVNVAAKYK